MTTHPGDTYRPASPAPGEATPRPRNGRALRPYALAVGAVAAVQGASIGALGLAGYFYLDDVDMSAEAAKDPFSWHYLTLPLNDHLTPGLRAVYWLVAHFAPYDNGVTVLGRVLVQAVATVLMGYLLGQLVGPGRAALLGLGLYAFSPLLVPSLLSLSSGVNLLPTHVGILFLLVMHVRYESTRRRKYAVLGAFGALLALVFWEKAVLSIALAPLLTFLYLSTGGLRARFAALVRSWPAWLAYAAAPVVFFVYFLLGPYGSHGSSPHLGDVWSIIWDVWLHSLAPSLVGGPWHWFSTKIVYYSASSPGWIATLCGELAVLGLSLLAIWRNGFAALRAWILPAFVLLGTAVLLAAGRFEYVGEILARNFHYFSELSIALVLAVVLLLVRVDPAAVAERGRSGLWPAGSETRRATLTRPVGIGLAIVVAAYALSYGTTVGGFERRWVQNPIRDYLTQGTSDLRTTTAKGPIAVYDNDVPGTVATLLQLNRRVSEVFRPVEADLPNGVRWDDASQPLYMFDSGGHLVKARFAEEASSADQPGVFCAHPLRGAGSVTVTLSQQITRPDAFARLDYLAQAPTKVIVRLASGNTTFAPRRNGTPTLRPGGYGAVLLGTPNKPFDRVVVTSFDPAAVLCLSAKAGQPEPAS
jgi:hypothetical protein